MFEFIIGDIVNMKEDYVVIQNNGIGYRVFTTKNSMMNIEIGKKNQLLYTELHVREDGLFLYGFTSEEELDMFNMLLTVSKIGPKIASGILSTLPTKTLKSAIYTKDIQTLCKAPGIGKKTAERMILELKDKVEVTSIEEASEIIERADDEAVEALISLGYSSYEVNKALSGLNRDLSLEDTIKEGLKKLSRH